MKWLDKVFERWKKPEKEVQAEPEKHGYRSYAAASAVAGAITPERLIAILKQADQGDITSQAELFGEMERRDGELLGLIGQRKAGVLACKSEIVPGDEKDKRSVKAAEFVQNVVDVLDAIDDGDNLQDNCFDMLDAIPKGFSALEIDWETSESQWWPARLHFRPQQWWQVDETDHNKLLLRDTKEYKGREINPLNFIIHRHRAISGTLTNSALAIACTRPFVIRNYAVKDWLVMAELFGMPARIGKLRQGASREEFDQLLDAVKSLGTAAYGVIPDGCEILLQEAAGRMGSAELYQKLVDMGGHWYALALLGQTLTSGGQEGGSYALGQVHQNVRFDLIDSDARRYDKRWSAFYAKLTYLNFGPDVAPPKHHTIVDEPKDLTALSNVVNVLVNAGVQIPASWAHNTFNIPEPQENEEILKPPAPALGGFGGFGGIPNAVANATGGPVGSALKKKDSQLWRERLAQSGPWLR